MKVTENKGDDAFMGSGISDCGIEFRRNVRIKERSPIEWSVQESKLAGRGKILNISTTGMMLEAESAVAQADQSLFSFHPVIQSDGTFLPRTGRMVWKRKKHFSKNSYLCGIEFINPSAEILASLTAKIHQGIVSLKKSALVTNGVGTGLFVILIALTGFLLLQQSVNYRNILSSHNLMKATTFQQAELFRTYLSKFQSSEKRLASVSGQLDETSILYNEAKSLLTEAQHENNILRAKILDVRTESRHLQTKIADYELLNKGQLLLKAELGKVIDDLKVKNIEYEKELAGIQGKLDFYEGNIESIDKGKELIQLFKNKISYVRSKIHYFQREAHYAKLNAQKEKDRIEMLHGNQGYLVKNGIPSNPDNQSAGSNSKQVEIDVTFY